MQFIDLRTQYSQYQEEIREAISDVLESTNFVDGKPVRDLEAALSQFSGSPNVIACSSGTDALYAGLIALDLQPGDEVIVPDFTFFATAEVVVRLGGIPVFADINPFTWTMDPADVGRKVTSKTKGIIPVSLFGQCADMEALQQITSRHGLWIFEDAAQSFGATQNGSMSCNLSEIACTSFFPSKPLGAYGNGGAVFCKDETLAIRIRAILSHGQESRYTHTSLGINGRMDSIQAAVLLVKLKHLSKELEARTKVATHYTERLQGYVGLPKLSQGNTSVWAQYSVLHKDRDKICKHLSEQKIPTSIHYPQPLHTQPAFRSLKTSNVNNPVSERLAKEIFSLPMHAFLSEEDQDQVCAAIRKAF